MKARNEINSSSRCWLTSFLLFMVDYLQDCLPLVYSWQLQCLELQSVDFGSHKKTEVVITSLWCAWMEGVCCCYHNGSIGLIFTHNLNRGGLSCILGPMNIHISYWEILLFHTSYLQIWQFRSPYHALTCRIHIRVLVDSWTVRLMMSLDCYRSLKEDRFWWGKMQNQFLM